MREKRARRSALLLTSSGGGQLEQESFAFNSKTRSLSQGAVLARESRHFSFGPLALSTQSPRPLGCEHEVFVKSQRRDHPCRWDHRTNSPRHRSRRDDPTARCTWPIGCRCDARKSAMDLRPAHRRRRNPTNPASTITPTDPGVGTTAKPARNDPCAVRSTAIDVSP